MFTLIIKTDLGSVPTGMHQLVGKYQRKHLISALQIMLPKIYNCSISETMPKQDFGKRVNALLS